MKTGVEEQNDKKNKIALKQLFLNKKCGEKLRELKVSPLTFFSNVFLEH